jgi:hypothetical protein
MKSRREHWLYCCTNFHNIVSLISRPPDIPNVKLSFFFQGEKYPLKIWFHCSKIEFILQSRTVFTMLTVLWSKSLEGKEISQCQQSSVDFEESLTRFGPLEFLGLWGNKCPIIREFAMGSVKQPSTFGLSQASGHRGKSLCSGIWLSRRMWKKGFHSSGEWLLISSWTSQE